MLPQTECMRQRIIEAKDESDVLAVAVIMMR